MDVMPKAFPVEFRDDVVAIARKGDSTMRQIAQDFGISESCLHPWMKQADIEDGEKPGTTTAEAAEVRELRKRLKLVEQENYIFRRAAAYLGRDVLPK
jgi:transposase